MTGTGSVGLAVPRDRAGRFELQLTRAPTVAALSYMPQRRRQDQEPEAETGRETRRGRHHRRPGLLYLLVGQRAEMRHAAVTFGSVPSMPSAATFPDVKP